MREDLVSGIICMVSDAEDLHGYSAHKLFFALRDDISQVKFCQILNGDNLLFLYFFLMHIQCTCSCVV